MFLSEKMSNPQIPGKILFREDENIRLPAHWHNSIEICFFSRGDFGPISIIDASMCKMKNCWWSTADKCIMWAKNPWATTLASRWPQIWFLGKNMSGPEFSGIWSVYLFGKNTWAETFDDVPLWFKPRILSGKDFSYRQQFRRLWAHAIKQPDLHDLLHINKVFPPCMHQLAL